MEVPERLAVALLHEPPGGQGARGIVQGVREPRNGGCLHAKGKRTDQQAGAGGEGNEQRRGVWERVGNGCQGPSTAEACRGGPASRSGCVACRGLALDKPGLSPNSRAARCACQGTAGAAQQAVHAAPCVPPPRHERSCSTARAATRLPHSPPPVMPPTLMDETMPKPGATMSGFMRPSVVGPIAEK